MKTFNTQALLGNCRAWLSGGDPAPMPDDDPAIFRGGSAHPIKNGVSRLVRADVAEAITAARTHLAGLDWVWWCGEDSRPGLADELRMHGAREAGTVPVMAVHLARMTAPAPPPELTIEEVTDADGLAEWVHAHAEPLGVPTDKVAAAVEDERDRSDAPGSYRRFVGRTDGRVVCTSAVLLAAGVAGVYVVATDERYQRRGYGTAITAAALRAAQAAGMSVGTLQASSAGRPVYERMGFETVARYHHFVL